MKYKSLIEAGQPPLQQAPTVSGSVTSRPILFSTDMVKAILEGRKTQTRRLFKVNKETITHQEENVFWDVEMGEAVYNSVGSQSWWNCPYGNIGDVLWVRETYAVAGNVTKWYIYKADLDYGHIEEKWKPSIFMPREACRIKLRITDIKVERLHSINEEDAIKEGVNVRYDKDEDGLVIYDGRAKEAFETLWSKINGQKSWDENPFVWVISFERTELPSKHYR